MADRQDEKSFEDILPRRERRYMEYRTSVNLAGVELKNPVMTASGTFGSGAEYSEFYDLSALGAVVTKGVANIPWPGNPTPRIAETASGMLNAIGLQNPGIDVFIERDIPFLRQFDTKIIVNVCGKTVSDYCEVVEKLSDQPVDLLEINVSCPNVKEGGIAFGQKPEALEEVTREVKKHAKQPVIMKLSPNVTSIGEMARAAEAGGADVLSLINTLTGMKIDIHKRAFVLANRTGGLSGPAVKPVAVRMVYEAAQAVSLPIIGIGGIQNSEDALEFILAGATAVSVGTANFANPYAAKETAEGIRAYMERYKIEKVRDLIGAVGCIC
jgi:dihydroorotate dehydrogenase (NAD+) catalytic subunit